MFNSSTNSSRIRSKSSSKYRCQASALATESCFSENLQYRRGRPAQERIAAWHACSADATTSRVCAPEEGQCLPDALASPFASLSPSPRAAPSHSRPLLLTERRHRCARSLLEKCAGHLAPSLAVISSTSSTSPSIQLCLGKGEITVSFHRHHG